VSGFRIFLIVLAGCVAAGAGGGYLVWRTFGPGAVEDMRRVQNEASEFAHANDQSACAREAFRRLRACGGFWCELQQPAFTKECLSNAEPADELCDEVPDSLIQGALWTQTACVDVDDVRPEICTRILREVLTVCIARDL